MSMARECEEHQLMSMVRECEEHQILGNGCDPIYKQRRMPCVASCIGDGLALENGCNPISKQRRMTCVASYIGDGIGLVMGDDKLVMVDYYKYNLILLIQSLLKENI